jgi:serine/threonine-protein kinase
MTLLTTTSSKSLPSSGELETLESAGASELAADLRHNRELLALGLSVPTDGEPGVGSVVGDYRLLEEIDRGGMGVVYRARQLEIEMYVALKVMRSAKLATPDERRRFQLEAERAVSLKHDNVVPIRHVGEHEGHPFFTMELIEGESLAQHLAGAFPDVARAVD